MSQFKLTCPYRSAYEGTAPHWLFVCNSGQLRSPTASIVANRELGYNTRSCGSELYSLIPVSLNLLKWADVVVFMDKYCYSQTHAVFTKAGFKPYLQMPTIYTWNISDSYQLMDPKLVSLIKQQLAEPHDLSSGDRATAF